MKNGRYNVGDSVLVADEITLANEEFTADNNPGFVDEMYTFCDRPAKITGLFEYEEEYYHIDVDGGQWWWSPAWLIPDYPEGAEIDLAAFDDLLQ